MYLNMNVFPIHSFLSYQAPLCPLNKNRHEKRENTQSHYPSFTQYGTCAKNVNCSQSLEKLYIAEWCLLSSWYVSCSFQMTCFGVFCHSEDLTRLARSSETSLSDACRGNLREGKPSECLLFQLLVLPLPKIQPSTVQITLFTFLQGMILPALAVHF